MNISSSTWNIFLLFQMLKFFIFLVASGLDRDRERTLRRLVEAEGWSQDRLEAGSRNILSVTKSLFHFPQKNWRCCLFCFIYFKFIKCINIHTPPPPPSHFMITFFFNHNKNGKNHLVCSDTQWSHLTSKEIWNLFRIHNTRSCITKSVGDFINKGRTGNRKIFRFISGNLKQIW